MIQLYLECDPKPWSAPQKSGRRFFDIKSKDKELARWQIRQQYRGDPMTCKVMVEFEFYLRIPKGTSKKKLQEMRAGIIRPTFPDCTNMQKLYEDCLQKIIIDNDRQVDRISSIRFYSERPGVAIRVYPWEELRQKEGIL